MLEGLWQTLTPTQQRERKECYESALEWVMHAPADGIDAPVNKPFRNRKQPGGLRIEIEITTGKACVDEPQKQVEGNP
jgi:hypothetical protein